MSEPEEAKKEHLETLSLVNTYTYISSADAVQRMSQRETDYQWQQRQRKLLLWKKKKKKSGNNDNNHKNNVEEARSRRKQHLEEAHTFTDWIL
ncbi:unnamed protein product [Sphagnum tenellum]